VLKLVTLRFDTGDVYPEYSSLRSDPLGTMAFYESVDGLSVLAASRDFSTTNRLPDGPGTTYLHLAASRSAMENLPDDVFREIERFANAGGRLVMTMYPIEAEQKRPSSPSDDAQKPKRSPYLERWGVDYEVVALERENDVYVPAFVDSVSDTAPLP